MKKNDFATETAKTKGQSRLLQKLCVVLSIITLIIYANSLQNGYVMDDLAVIESNTIVKKGFSGIPELLTTPRFKGFENIVNDSYRPLSLVTFAIEYQLFDNNPALGHLFNILFFIGCVVLLFLFLDKLFSGQKTGLAFMAALLFALHPIHTEVVANIKSRDELLCFFFAFWALNVFINYARKGGLMQLTGGVILLFLSFLSKETVISFVFVIPVLFLFYLNGDKKRSGMISAGTLVVAIIFLCIRHIVLKNNNSSAIPFLDNPLANSTFFARLPTAIMVLGIYLKLLFVPYPLISDYSYNSIPFAGFTNIAFITSLAVYVFLIWVGVSRFIKKSKDPLAFGILFFLVTIALFSNIPFLVYSEMAERLAFFASAGFCIGIAALLWELLGNPHSGNQLVPPKIWYVIVPVSIVFAGLTISRNADWQSNDALTATDVKKAPDNARLWHSMGYILLTTEVNEESDPSAKQEITREGIADLQRSLAIYPDNGKAHQDLGNFFRGLQQYDSAESHLKEAVRLNPNSLVPVSDLGFVYFCEQKYREALDLAQTALLKDKQNVLILNNIAMCYLQMRVYDSTQITLKQALAIDPENKQAKETLSRLNRAVSQKDTTKTK